MRTTVTLEPDVDDILRRRMSECGETFKQALNGAVRASARPARARVRVRKPTFDMGESRFDLTKANELAGELENEEIIRKMHQGK